MKNYLVIIGILSFQLITFSQSFAQIFSGVESKKSAISNIAFLQKGILIVPLFEQSNRFKEIQALLDDPDLSEKYRIKLEKKVTNEKNGHAIYNDRIVHHFSKNYHFSRVYFIYDSQLQAFSPSSAIFLNPLTLKADSSIQMMDENYYFLRYKKTTGPVSSPDEIRFFYIADKNFSLLERPFPNSPGRRSSFSMRFRDFLNINPDPDELINMLVTKLNRNLYRYLKKQNSIL